MGIAARAQQTPQRYTYRLAHFGTGTSTERASSSNKSHRLKHLNMARICRHRCRASFVKLSVHRKRQLVPLLAEVTGANAKCHTARCATSAVHRHCCDASGHLSPPIHIDIGIHCNSINIIITEAGSLDPMLKFARKPSEASEKRQQGGYPPPDPPPPPL
jgi:hypothetical protein